MYVMSVDVEATLGLRQKILRPGLGIEDCRFPGDWEATTTHLGCYAQSRLGMEQLVGIVSLYQQPNSSIMAGNGYQIRAMATDEQARGRGCGSALLSAAESEAAKVGADYLWANARISAQRFYEKQGYQVNPTQFLIEGVGMHVLIHKRVRRTL